MENKSLIFSRGTDTNFSLFYSDQPGLHTVTFVREEDNTNNSDIINVQGFRHFSSQEDLLKDLMENHIIPCDVSGVGIVVSARNDPSVIKKLDSFREGRFVVVAWDIKKSRLTLVTGTQQSHAHLAYKLLQGPYSTLMYVYSFDEILPYIARGISQGLVEVITM